jgi:hypothetical protein
MAHDTALNDIFVKSLAVTLVQRKHLRSTKPHSRKYFFDDHFTMLTKDGQQELLLFQSNGSDSTYYCFVRSNLSKHGNASYKYVPNKLKQGALVSNLGIQLGIPIAKFTQMIDTQHAKICKGDSVQSFYFSYGDSVIRERGLPNFPRYVAEYHFVNERLVAFGFGFPFMRTTPSLDFRNRLYWNARKLLIYN